MTAILPYPVRGPLPPPLLLLCSLSSSSSSSNSISKNMPIFTATIGSISLPSHLLNPEAISSLSSSSSCRLSYSRPFNFSFRASQLLAAARPSFRVSASADDSQKTANSTAVLDDSSGSEETIDPLLQARMSADWKAAKGHFETGLIYEGRIESYNKGGFLVRFYSLVGFLPFRQLSPSHAWKEPRRSIQQIALALVGSLISTKVIEVDEESRRLIFSEKDAIWAKYSEKINVGDICAGIVGSVEDYGAFIHLCFPDGLYHVTGMVHASEVSWDLVQDVRDVLTVGDEVRVKVISIDRSKSRINLSIKQLEGDPFLQTLEKAIPQDNSTGSDALSTSSAIEPLPGLQTIFDELLKEDGIEDVRINRQGFEKRVVSQDLQLWLSNAPPVERKFTLLARAGRQVQEIQLTTLLDQEGIKKALQRALERVP